MGARESREEGRRRGTVQSPQSTVHSPRGVGGGTLEGGWGPGGGCRGAARCSLGPRPSALGPRPSTPALARSRTLDVGSWILRIVSHTYTRVSHNWGWEGKCCIGSIGCIGCFFAVQQPNSLAGCEYLPRKERTAEPGMTQKFGFQSSPFCAVCVVCVVCGRFFGFASGFSPAEHAEYRRGPSDFCSPPQRARHEHICINDKLHGRAAPPGRPLFRRQSRPWLAVRPARNESRPASSSIPARRSGGGLRRPAIPPPDGCPANPFGALAG